VRTAPLRCSGNSKPAKRCALRAPAVQLVVFTSCRRPQICRACPLFPGEHSEPENVRRAREWAGRRRPHLVFGVRTLALQAVHVAAHARRERLLELYHVRVGDAGAQLLFEFCGSHRGGRRCATRRDVDAGVEGGRARRHATDAAAAAAPSYLPSLCPCDLSPGSGSFPPRRSPALASQNATAGTSNSHTLRAACALIVMKTEPFWQALKTLLSSARKVSGVSSTMRVGGWGGVERRGR
jgi:hypothetical protein